MKQAIVFHILGTLAVPCHRHTGGSAMSPKIVRCLMLPLLLMPLGIPAQQDPIAAAKAIHNPGDRSADRSVIALLLPLEEAGKLDDADALNMLGLSCIQPLVPAREQHPCRNRLGELFVKASERGNVSAMYGASHWLMDKPARGMFYTDAQRVESLAWAMLALHFNTDAGQRDALNRIVAQKTSELARQSRGNESLAQRAAGLAESRKAALTPWLHDSNARQAACLRFPTTSPTASANGWARQASSTMPRRHTVPPPAGAAWITMHSNATRSGTS
ncbi:MAG: hypothetical protein NVV60_10415 [Luteimonas sp.]|nr:hypothetical protein [Luteimonas sp.]